MSERLILKLGGSVITDKTGDCAINHGQLAAVAAAIAASKAGGFVIIHGAGSCGHPEAKRYHLDLGVESGKTEGIVVTHRVVSGLNEAVVDALRAQGVAAAGIHPLHACVADNGRLAAFGTRHIEKMLDLGMVPVIHGDVVMDLSRGACIVSGDQLAGCLARALKIGRVGLATDVPGVLDTDGAVVPVITRKSAGAIRIGSSRHTDVTGGMRGKIEEMLGLADHGIRSDIFHVSRISDFLSGSAHGGTVVRGD